MSRIFPAAILATGILLSGSAFSADYRYDRDDGRYDDARYEWAEVVRVDPIIENASRPVVSNQCYQQPVVYREPVRYRSDRNDRAPAVLGAIIGGAIGNQFGRGHGRDAATAAGALLGYHAVRDDQRRYGGSYAGGGREYTRYEDRCTSRTEYVRDQTVTGYDVTYRYQGRTYRTVTDYDPGESIQIAVDVRPVR